MRILSLCFLIAKTNNPRAAITPPTTAVADKAVAAAEADFDKVWDSGMADYLAAGGQDIIDERLEKWTAAYGSATMLP